MAGRTYETAIRISAQLASTFKSVVGGASGEVAKLNQQVAKLAAVDKSTERFARLTSRVSEARVAHNRAVDALDHLTASARASGVATKEMADWMAAGEKEVKRAAKELERAEKTARDAGVALQVAGVDTSKLASEQKRLGAEVAATERRIRGLSAASAAYRRLVGERGLMERIFGDPKEALLDKAGRQVGGIVRDAARLGVAGIGAGVGLVALVKRAADAGDAVDDAAGRLGIGGAALQAFHAQAKLAGAGAEDADTAIGKLAVNIGKAMQAKKGKGGGGAFGPIEGLTIFGQGGGGGDGPEPDPFKRLKLSAKELSKLKPEQQVEIIADRISGLKTQSEQAAAAAAIFGKSGTKLLPLLREGSAGIRRFREEGVRTGRFMSDDATKAASDFNDALDALSGRGVTALVNALGGTLLPVGTRTLQQITAYVSENQDKIKAWAETAKVWIETKAIPAVQAAGTWFFDTAQKVAAGVQRVADLVGGFDNLVVAIAALRGAGLVVTLGQGVVQAISLAKALYGAATAARALAAAQAGAGAAGGAAGAAGIAGAAAGILGKLGAAAAAGAAGYALGSWADEKLGISDTLSGMEAQKAADAAAFAEDELRRARARAARGGGPLVAGAVAGGSTTQITYAPNITVQAGASKQEMEAVTQAGHDDFEQRQRKLEAERRRVGYGG